MKPRIASYYESRLGRNDGNPLYVSHCLRNEFRDYIEYHHLVPDPALQFELLGKFDLYLWIDWGEDALASVLPYAPIACPKPNAYWASDTHLGYDYRLERARQFDYIFCAQKIAVDQFLADGIQGHVEWLPHAVDPRVYNPGAMYAQTPDQLAEAQMVHRLKQWDIGFCGHINDDTRLDLLDRVFTEFPNSWFGSLRTGRVFERAADLYTQAKVCLNHAIRDDVNMRVFEVLATRSFLLTPAVSSLDELFTDGTHLVTYTGIDDAVEKAHYYVDHEEERERIAEAGYYKVLADHTMTQRVKHILHTTGVLPHA